MAVANCSEQVVNQNTNVAVEKKTSALTVKGFSVVNQQIRFRTKGIYLQINRKKKGKKGHPEPNLDPDPESAFY